ncbi:tRNA 5-(aminomethyl)-2-thiouridylate-methyltransferase MnmM [Tepidimicrobium xylanilyticum]|uniref:Putative rRNA methylase n=1 Tax=Tepidimicrobium xylanilyticum TaxID=1123352 RepID=A0A1H3CV46_9FIRM|nr:class I SAM-dependent methyltransferase [Tepidimicrobium xylanilyticum]GMG97748.1 rRNA methyltransferase [Tepidimicrobium xylanilyticum]SDX58102.1 Putative rRNA methylase [Tepidimicrobium xylanilyticum]
MRFEYFNNAVDLAKKLMCFYVKEGYRVCDCTVGNGNDTVLLAKLVGESGKVYGFDIQSVALNITREKLYNENLENRVILIEDGHENIDKHVNENINFAIYNLGYLPGGNKKIKTNVNTTLISLEKSLSLLKSNGLLLVTCYTGHEGGIEEKEGVMNFLRSLRQNEYHVIEFNFLNQKNYPPTLYGVEKL